MLRIASIFHVDLTNKLKNFQKLLENADDKCWYKLIIFPSMHTYDRGMSKLISTEKQSN